jgi:hypothetical protein
MPSLDLDAGRSSLPRSRAATAGWIAAALAFALSPVLMDLIHHLVEQPWARYALIFPPLVVWRLVRAEPTPISPRLGCALVVVALAVELVAVGGGVPRFGRPAIPLAIAGLCRAFGLAAWPTILLACWCVPVPISLVSSLPLVEGSSRLAAALLGGVSLQGGSPPTLVAEAGALVLRPHDGGLPLAGLLSGLGWLVALRAGRGLGGCARAAAWMGLAALSLALLAVLLAAVLLAAGHLDAARWTRDGMPWVVGGALGLAFVLRTSSPERRP